MLHFFLNFDRGVCWFLNQFAQRSPACDQAMVVLSNSDLAKGGVILALFWAMWFRRGDLARQREYLLGGLVGSLVALFIARLLAYLFPSRLRPILDPAMHFLPPISLPDQSNWTSWSSFPSDHAALFVALICGIWAVSRRAGIASLLYFLFVICLPRLYVGIHYPSDLVAGATIALLIVLLLTNDRIRKRWTGPLLRLLERWPATGYGLLFFLSFQIATLFWDVRIALNYFGFST